MSYRHLEDWLGSEETETFQPIKKNLISRKAYHKGKKDRSVARAHKEKAAELRASENPTHLRMIDALRSITNSYFQSIKGIENYPFEEALPAITFWLHHHLNLAAREVLFEPSEDNLMDETLSNECTLNVLTPDELHENITSFPLTPLKFAPVFKENETDSTYPYDWYDIPAMKASIPVAVPSASSTVIFQYNTPDILNFARQRALFLRNMEEPNSAAYNRLNVLQMELTRQRSNINDRFIHLMIDTCKLLGYKCARLNNQSIHPVSSRGLNFFYLFALIPVES